MPLASFHPAVAAVGIQHPALLIVDEVGDHHLVKHLGVDRRILDRKHILDAPVELRGIQSAELMNTLALR